MTHEISLSVPINYRYILTENLLRQALPKKALLAVLMPTKKRINKDSFSRLLSLITSDEKHLQPFGYNLSCRLLMAYRLTLSFTNLKSVIL